MMRLKRFFCKFHKKCVFSPEVRHRALEMARIRGGKTGPMSYCILAGSRPDEQLVIVPSVLLGLTADHTPIVIYGVSKTRRGAYDIIAHFSDLAIRAGMPGEPGRYVREYLDREHGQGETSC